MIQDSSISQLIDRVTQSPVYPITKQIVVMDASGSQDLTTYITEYNISVHQLNKIEGSPRYDTSIFTLGEAIQQVPNEYRRGGLNLIFNTSTSEDSAEFSETIFCRLIHNIWSKNPSNWMGIDEEPTDKSINFVRSGGVYNLIHNSFSDLNNLIVLERERAESVENILNERVSNIEDTIYTRIFYDMSNTTLPETIYAQEQEYKDGKWHFNGHVKIKLPYKEDYLIKLNNTLSNGDIIIEGTHYETGGNIILNKDNISNFEFISEDWITMDSIEITNTSITIPTKLSDLKNDIINVDLNTETITVVNGEINI